MNSPRSKILYKVLTGATWLVFLASFAALNAQVQTKTETSQGQATQDTSVERGEVVYVSGNDLVVKMDNGEMRHFANVPETARIEVDGQQLGVHDLKPGMKLQRTITTTSVPQTITTVHTVAGKVWHVNPPDTVILTLEDGSNQSFKIPKGQKFMVNGKETDAWHLKKGMQVSATKVEEAPYTAVQQQSKVTGSMPPPPAPPADVPILIAQANAPEPVAQPKEPKKLPQTGSPLPLVGLLGALAIGASLAVRFFQRSKA